MALNEHHLTYVSVDTETAGPSPSEYALLSIGACLIEDPQITFYRELMPDKEAIEPTALEVSGLDLNQLKQHGVPAREAMQAFDQWLGEVVPQGASPVFVAFNAPFDWMFVADYFHRYLGRNPFGHRALDIKALYMGLFAVSWGTTSMAEVTEKMGLTVQLRHHALQDAQDQAAIFKALTQKRREDNE